MPYRLIRPLVFRFDAERAHGLTIAALWMLPEIALRETSPRLRTSVAGWDFPLSARLLGGSDNKPEAPGGRARVGSSLCGADQLHPPPLTTTPTNQSYSLKED